jgi:hypothetical protein
MGSLSSGPSTAVPATDSTVEPAGQVRAAGVELPLTRLWAELEQVREVVNVYPGRGVRQPPVRQAVGSRLTALQERLVEVLGLRGEKGPV